MNELYNQVDMMIFPSLAENYPLTVMEAQATGVCVIGATTGGIIEQLEEGRGFLFERNNSEALLKTLQLVLHQNLDDIRQVGQKAFDFAQKNYSKQQVFDNYTNLYQELISKKS
jgi:glycosyltransferase involved in cell wall biosynthesis